MRAHETIPAERVASLGHHARAFLLPALIVASAPTPAAADGSVSVDAGVRSLDEETWDPIDNQTTEGYSASYARSGWPVELAIGWHTSEGEETASEFVPDGGGGCWIPFLLCYRTGETIEHTLVRVSLKELSLGVDKSWVSSGSKARGFIGGGVSQLQMSLDNRQAGFGEDDRSAGLWAHAGIVWRWPIFEDRVHWEFGVEARALQGTSFRFGGERSDADYVQLGLLTGIRWSS